MADEADGGPGAGAAGAAGGRVPMRPQERAMVRLQLCALTRFAYLHPATPPLSRAVLAAVRPTAGRGGSRLPLAEGQCCGGRVRRDGCFLRGGAAARRCGGAGRAIVRRCYRRVLAATPAEARRRRGL